MPLARTNDIDIYYEVHGQGDPLILINGLGYDHWVWHRMVPGLAENFLVITFDSRGSGQSDKPPGPYSAKMLADDTAGLLETLGYEQSAVMGHSMGGVIAQSLVTTRPELVSKLILSDTDFGGPNHIPVTDEAMAILTDPDLDPLERMRQGIIIACAPGFGENNPDFINEWMDYRFKHPIEPEHYQSQLAIGLALKFASLDECFQLKLQDVEAPTLILFGEHDNVVPTGNAELLAKEIPNSKVEYLPNAGHLYMFEVPEVAVEKITAFLNA